MGVIYLEAQSVSVKKILRHYYKQTALGHSLNNFYAFIEANERPGLANHEPQPTAERFVDLLFALSIPTAVRIAAA